MKVITICGSMKFKEDMMIVAEKLALNGYCVLTPIYSVSENKDITENQIESLKKAHYKRIDFSDSILVMNINGYIGSSTKLEIDYAQRCNKEVLYLSNLDFIDERSK